MVLSCLLSFFARRSIFLEITFITLKLIIRIRSEIMIFIPVPRHQERRVSSKDAQGSSIVVSSKNLIFIISFYFTLD